MGFDTERFRSTALEPRTEDVPVKDLAGWFADGEAPVWTVRGLTGEEFMRAQDAEEQHRLRIAAFQALVKSGAFQGERVAAFESLIGGGNEIPAQMAKLIECILLGSVRPVVDRDLVVRLYQSFPVTAYLLGMTVLKLTGQGAAPPGGATISTDAPT